MGKASVVPDTNVLVSNLEAVRAVFNYEFPGICTLNISRTVIQELDGLKKKRKEARDAIKFIESVSLSLKTEIEGYIDDRKMDVEVEYKEAVRESNNDDRIMNYIFKLENPILLTNDVGFALKCQSFNIKVISMREATAEAVISRILEAMGEDVPARDSVGDAVQSPTAPAEGPVAGEQPDPGLRKAALESFKQNFKSAIEPRIHQILLREVGDTYTILLRGDLSLEFYLKFIVKNFFLFENYFPKNSVSFINALLGALKSENIEAVISNAKVVYVMFGLIPGEN